MGTGVNSTNSKSLQTPLRTEVTVKQVSCTVAESRYRLVAFSLMEICAHLHLYKSIIQIINQDTLHYLTKSYLNRYKPVCLDLE